MFLASNICWVSSGTVRALGQGQAEGPRPHLYCWLPLAVRGAKPGMKKCSLGEGKVRTAQENTKGMSYLGKGTMLTASFLRSALSWPGKRRLVVTPDMVRETRWFRSP